MESKNSKMNLTKEMKIYLLTSIQKGYFLPAEFEKVFGINILIDDPFSKMRKNNGITEN